MDTTSTFIVTEFTPSDQELDVETALPTGLAMITKRFSGAIEGHSQAMFCSAFDPTHGGTYVALESFDGQVDGRHGLLLVRARRDHGPGRGPRRRLVHDRRRIRYG